MGLPVLVLSWYVQTAMSAGPARRRSATLSERSVEALLRVSANRCLRQIGSLQSPSQPACQDTRNTGAMVRVRAPLYTARMRQSTSMPSFSVCSGRVPERRQFANSPISTA